MFSALTDNPTILAALAGWLLAQVIKLGLALVRHRKFDPRFLTRTGGLPSAHAATAAACATSVGLRSGFDSPVFAVALGILALVMIDAQGVRRAAGEQARLLNKLSEDFCQKHGGAPGKLMESLGHSSHEVWLGAALGITTASLTHQLLPAILAAA